MTEQEKQEMQDELFEELATDETSVELPEDTPAGEATTEQQKNGFLSRGLVWLVVGVIIGGLGGFFLYAVIMPENTSATAPLAGVESSSEINEGEPHRQVMMAVIANARHFYGDPNAPVTLVEFGDFNCGYCGKWTKETLPLIDEKYIQTGKVRMAYVHYPILGADSMTASEAAECAAEQGQFWEYHNVLYAHQGIGYSKENLISLAEQQGLDGEALGNCLDNFPDRESLEDDIRLSQVMGVRGTPAFLVNGIPLAGAYPYENFEQIIEGALAGEF